LYTIPGDLKMKSKNPKKETKKVKKK